MHTYLRARTHSHTHTHHLMLNYMHMCTLPHSRAGVGPLKNEVFRTLDMWWSINGSSDFGWLHAKEGA